MPVAQLMKLRGEQALAITLCRITAVAIAPTDLLQFVVKVSHSRLAASLSGFRLLPLGVVCVVVVGVFNFW